MSDANPFDLPEDRLATTSQSGSRIYLYPAQVTGFFRTYRSYLYQLLIIIFLVLPWIDINGHQAVLFDIPGRKFALFGLTFWAHNAPMMFFVFVSFVLTAGLVTTLFGRIWCGWACPQTVFIDSWFRRIEQWTEGSPAQRRRLDQAPWHFTKIRKRVVKWVLYLGASLVITHSFLAYFVGSDRLAGMVTQAPTENWVSFLTVCVTTAIILFDFAWFREQFCIIACPYGRLQSVLMDEDSLAICYDDSRGEPRKANRKDTAFTGDCINCFRCVQVCPTGIDIRRGVQMECIMCTACIDACDAVMTKINKPKGLIRYDTENSLKGLKKRFFRPRVFVYAVLLTCALGGLAWTVSAREMITVHFTRLTTAPYQVLDSGHILNPFQLRVRNQHFSDHYLFFSLPKDSPDVKLVLPLNPVKLKGSEIKELSIFIQFDATILKDGKAVLPIQTRANKVGSTDTQTFIKEVNLIGPLH